MKTFSASISGQLQRADFVSGLILSPQMGTRALINSWHGEAAPSRQCCCGIAGVGLCSAPGRYYERSWQMVLKGCESSYTKLSLSSLPVRSTEWEGTGGEIKLSLTEGGMCTMGPVDRVG